MLWMLIGGGSLFALIVAGVLVAMKDGNKQAAQVPTKPLKPVPESAAGQSLKKNDAAITAEAEPLARKFLEATSVDEILPLLRNRDVAEARIRKFYPDGKISAPGMAAFNTLSEVSRMGSFLSFNIRTRDFEDKALTYVDTPEGLKIDWECWVGWSATSWDDFVSSKSTETKVFRLNLGSVDYYNVGFKDDQKWQSYRLISPDGKHSIYGYAERGSVLNARLRPPPDIKQMPMILALKFPENATSANQVIIESLVAEGWAVENEESP